MNEYLIPEYLKDTSIWAALWPLLVAPLVIAALIGGCLVNPRRRPSRFRFVVLAAFTFGIFGIVTGNVTGLSRDPAVGVVIPAILTLISGAVIYLIGTKGRLTQLYVSAGVIALSINLLLGMSWGSKSRVIYETDYRSQAFQRPRELAEEDTKLALALWRLINEVTFNEKKNKMEKQFGVSLGTQYAPASPEEKPSKSNP